VSANATQPRDQPKSDSNPAPTLDERSHSRVAGPDLIRNEFGFRPSTELVDNPDARKK
jgi:hypothetical protein